MKILVFIVVDNCFTTAIVLLLLTNSVPSITQSVKVLKELLLLLNFNRYSCTLAQIPRRFSVAISGYFWHAVRRSAGTYFYLYHVLCYNILLL